MNMTYAAIGYTLLGYFLSAHPTSRRWPWGAAALGGFAVTFGGTWLASCSTGALSGHFLEGMSVGVCLLAAGLYGLCIAAPVGDRAERILSFVSRASFCVFLVHIFFLKVFAHFGLTALAGPAVVTVPVLSALLLGCGCGVYAVLSRIPGVRRWLV